MKKQYNLLIGLNDKDKLVQVIDTLNAYKVVNNILTNNGVNGYSIMEQLGYFTNEKKETTIEKSLSVMIISDTELDLTNIIKQIKTTLNQESIGLITSNVNVNWV